VKISFFHWKVYFCMIKTKLLILKIKFMKTKKLAFLSMTLLFAAGYLLTTCSKNDDATQVLVKDRPNISRTINYTVLVVAGETAATNSSTKKSAVEATGATGATVQVAVNGSVLSKTTDISGQAAFTNLTAGIAAVSVELANHTTVNYVVNLYHIDSMHYDNEKSRIFSTKVVVFPTSGTGMITVSGLVNMQSDIRVEFPNWAFNSTPYVFVSPGYEFAPAGTVVTAVVSNSEFSKYVTSLDGGSLTDITYEGITFTGSVDATGNYTISVPSTGMGLSVKIYVPDVATTVSYSAKTHNAANDSVLVNPTTFNYLLTDKTQRFIFGETSTTITAYTSKNLIQDITYGNPTIIDLDYFGDTSYQP
jgi:hypothetical protein